MKPSPERICRGAHAPRVLAIAPSRSRTFQATLAVGTKRISARAPKSAREARALPRTSASPRAAYDQHELPRSSSTCIA